MRDGLLEDFEELADFRVAFKEGPGGVDFGHDAARGPHINAG